MLKQKEKGSSHNKIKKTQMSVLYCIVLCRTVLYPTVFTYLTLGVLTWQTITSRDHNKSVTKMAAVPTDI